MPPGHRRLLKIILEESEKSPTGAAAGISLPFGNPSLDAFFLPPARAIDSGNAPAVG